MTPAGAVQTGGQGIGINVNGQTGETTVIGLPGAGAAASGNASSVQFMTPGAGNAGITVPSQGMVFNPSSGATSGAGAASTTSTGSTMGSSQMAPIAKLISAPSSTDAGGQGAASGLGTPLANPAPALNFVNQISSNLNTGSDLTKGSAPFSGANLAAPISSSGSTLDQKSRPLDIPIQTIAVNPLVEPVRPLQQAVIVMPVVPIVSVLPLTAAVDERIGLVRVTVKLSEATTQPVTVNWAVDGTGSVGAASVLRVPSGTGQLQFSPGETSKEIEVAIHPDFERQTAGSFSLTLQSTVGGVLGSPTTQTVNIIDVAAMIGDEAPNTMTGGTGSDTLRGEQGDDSLSGGDGADMLDGGSDNDTLIGGVGDDTLDGGSGNDLLDGGAGVDSVVAGDGDDVIV
ncbi:MAG: Calx-beta domain-containing protein, partial [Pseudomonadota bacterium]